MKTTNTMKILLSLALMLMTSTLAYSQSNSTIRGEIENMNIELSGGYSVGLINARDSSTIAWEYFKTNDFSIDYDKEKNPDAIIYFVAYSYKDLSMRIDPAKLDLGKIKMELLAVALDEVTVTSKQGIRVTQSNSQGKTTFAIPTAVSSFESNIYGLLAKMPGLDVQGKEVTALGFGKVIFIINGIEAREGDLDLLRPDMIDKIVVDRNPSARYDHTVKAVVDIITKKNLKDHLKLVVSDNLTYDNKKISNYTFLQLDHKAKKWENQFLYSGFLNNSAYEQQSTHTINTDQGPLYKYNNTENETSMFSNTAILGSKYNINDNSFVDLQYIYSIMPDVENRSKNNLEIPYYATDIVDGNSDDYQRLHSVAMRYDNNFDNGNKLTVNASYRDYIYTQNELTEELLKMEGKPDTYLSTFVDNQSKISMLTAALNYKFKIYNNLSAETGFLYSNVTNNSETDLNKGEQFSKTHRNEHQGNLYLNLTQSWEKFSYNIGLREELFYVADKDNQNPLSFMPSLLLNYAPSKKVSMSLYARRYTIYPTLNQLNPGYYYLNFTSYLTGNPNLVPNEVTSFTYNINLPYKINFSLAYTINDEAVFTNELKDPNGLTPYDTYRTFDNMGKYENIKTNIQWSRNFGKLYTLNSNFTYEQVVKGNMQYRDMDSYKPYLSGYLNNIFYLSENVNFNILGQYTSTYDMANYHVPEVFRVQAGVNFSLLNNNLIINVNGSYRSGQDRITYNDYVVWDSKRISPLYTIGLAVTYKLNNFRTSYRTNNFDSQVSRRLN